jgi:hypothetical protein
MNRTLTPAQIIASLKQDIGNFRIQPLVAPPPAGATAIYYKLRIMVDGAERQIKINVDRPITLDYGVANPTNANDKRNKFVKADGKKEHNINFNLADAELVEMFDLLQAGFYAALQRAWDSNSPLQPSKAFGKRPVHTLIDRIKPDYDNCAGIVTTAAADSKPFERPRVTLRARLEKRPMTHKVEAWRGTPETVIMDVGAPIIQRVGQVDKVAGYKTAMIDGAEINWANAYKFLNSGAQFLNTIFELSDLCYSPTFLSAPFILTRALVRKGTGAVEDNTDWSKYYTPAVAAETPIDVAAAMPAVQPAPQPAPVTTQPTAQPTSTADADLAALLGAVTE